MNVSRQGGRIGEAEGISRIVNACGLGSFNRRAPATHSKLMLAGVLYARAVVESRRASCDNCVATNETTKPGVIPSRLKRIAEYSLMGCSLHRCLCLN